jgi:glc operon protein GlcG
MSRGLPTFATFSSATCKLALLALLCTMTSLTLFAQAQAPATLPNTAPPLPYGPSIGVDAAKKAAAAALAEARKNNWFMAIAVVDTSGTLVYYEKMDNTQTGSATVAIDKAKTAALFKRPSKAFQDAVAAGGPGLRVLALPGATPIEGGLPIIVNNQVIGAIGVSGGSSEQDGVCAQAGAATAK